MRTFGLFQVGLGIVLMLGVPLVLGTSRMYAWPLFVWPGASVFIVGLGYLGLGAGVFDKSSARGQRSRVRVILLFPYLLVAWSIWHLKSLLEREAPFSEVSPGLYVGRRPRHAGEVPKDARVVVDLTSEFDRSPLTLGIARYHCLPTLDTAAPDVDALRAFVIALEGEERPLFIHCAMGHGRSATVAGALIVRAGLAASATEARTLMRLARPRIYLHPVQVQVIDALREHAPRVDTEAAAR